MLGDMTECESCGLIFDGLDAVRCDDCCKAMCQDCGDQHRCAEDRYLDYVDHQIDAMKEAE